MDVRDRWSPRVWPVGDSRVTSLRFSNRFGTSVSERTRACPLTPKGLTSFPTVTMCSSDATVPLSVKVPGTHVWRGSDAPSRTKRSGVRLLFRVLERLPNSGASKERPNGHRRLGPFVKPIQYPIRFQIRDRRILQGIMRPDDLDVLSIPARPGIHGHHPIKRPFVPAHAG